MNAHEQRQAERKERLEAAAEKARKEASAQHQRSHDLVAGIPPGQPILIGHHSEARHRRAVDGSWNALGKAVEATHRAEDLAYKAASVGTGGISSDDPEAVEKLAAQLAALEEKHERMKRENVLIRKQDRAGLIATGLSEAAADRLLTYKDCFGNLGHSTSTLALSKANISRIKERIEHLQRQAVRTEREPIQGDGWLLEDDKNENRVTITFDAIPPKDTRQRLCQAGFKWSPTRNAWVRMASNAAWDAALYALQHPRS